VTTERAILLRRSYRELAAGGVGWSRRRDIFAITARRTTWRAEVAFGLWLKRALDLVGALALLVVTTPILLAVAVAIKLEDGGPVFFRQVRVGKDGRHFVIFKFRSMVRNAEALKAQLLAQNEMRDGILFKIRKDPRITRVGRLIRKLSLDELPQVFNVVLGEMSLVGPRPPVPSEVARYEPAHRRRLSARPGITCLWQVSGRNEIDFPGQVRLDVQYIERQSLGLDLAILLRTIPAVISGRGAS
jgi:lipopolysaccharide/colanic/teichoic acid biosynthesis glycosyltransferase